MSIHDSITTAGKSGSTQRRSHRVLISIAITVRGKGERQFSEETRTIAVSTHGALITLTTKVEMGATILVKNRATQDEQVCKVTYLCSVAAGRTEVGIGFREPAPRFWGIQFPSAPSGGMADSRPAKQE